MKLEHDFISSSWQNAIFMVIIMQILTRTNGRKMDSHMNAAILQLLLPLIFYSNAQCVFVLDSSATEFILHTKIAMVMICESGFYYGSRLKCHTKKKLTAPPMNFVQKFADMSRKTCNVYHTTNFSCFHLFSIWVFLYFFFF